MKEQLSIRNAVIFSSGVLLLFVFLSLTSAQTITPENETKIAGAPVVEPENLPGVPSIPPDLNRAIDGCRRTVASAWI
jgi:hypothetical protein